MKVRVKIPEIDLTVELDITSLPVGYKLYAATSNRQYIDRDKPPDSVPEKEKDILVLDEKQLAGLLFEDSRGWLTRRAKRYGKEDDFKTLKTAVVIEAIDHPTLLAMVE